MKSIIIFGLLLAVNVVWPNWTRMNTLMVGDYLDDVVNIAIYPQHILIFENTFYSDIMSHIEDYGIIIAPKPKYGSIGLWQNKGFNIGYGLNLFRFDLGIWGSPVKDRTKIGFGIGRSYFASRADFSIIRGDAKDDEYYTSNLRLLKRQADFVIILKYTFSNFTRPYDYVNQKIGLMIQRLVLDEGFVFLSGEYVTNRGAIEEDLTTIYAGFELPLNKTVFLRIGCRETFTNEFVPLGCQVEPGIGFHIREFKLDFHINKEKLFNKYLTFVNSFGLDLDFGRF